MKMDKRLELLAEIPGVFCITNMGQRHAGTKRSTFFNWTKGLRPQQRPTHFTSDCSDAYEIDDGVFMQPLPSAAESYGVGVCVADTSKLYQNGDVRKMAFGRVHADYLNLPNGERGYDPLLDKYSIRTLS